MYSEIFVENIKCFGCKNTVIKEAKKQDLVESVDVDINTGKVGINYQGGDETLARVKSRLFRKGYPVKGSHKTQDTNSKFATCDLEYKQEHQRYQVRQYDFTED